MQDLAHPTPRTLIVSQRMLSRDLARACPYTFEDLILQIEPAVKLDLESTRSTSPRVAALSDAIRRRMNLVVHRDECVKRCELDRDYDLLFFHCQNIRDLHRIDRITNWRQRCVKAVVWLDDIWPSDLKKYNKLLEPLEVFDHCIVGLADSSRALRSWLKCSTSFVPPAVDTALFNPYRLNLPRSLDMYWMGRRIEATHQAIRRYCEDERQFYLYDTAASGQFGSHVEHRQATARLINRSRYFVVHRSRVNDDVGRTGSYEGFGFRYFEGAAGGAVMLGGVPDTDEFRQAFDWPDVVFPLDGTLDQLKHTMNALENDPDRVRHIRASNVAGCLRRHDWSHRWRTILEAVGMTPDGALLDRQQQLEEEAEKVMTQG